MVLQGSETGQNTHCDQLTEVVVKLQGTEGEAAKEKATEV